MTCDRIQAAMNLFQTCAETPSGSRVMTHCLYPSFEPVDVYIHGFGDGFRVHDRGGARREAWLHCVEEGQMTRILNAEAGKHQIGVENGALVATAQSPEWLFAAITAVANASANAAKIAIDSVSLGTEDTLVRRIEDTLFNIFPDSMVRKHYGFRGKSGKEHHFDFALRGGGDRTILINAVTSHHFSVSSRYVSFADTIIKGYESVGRFAVFDHDPDNENAALLGQVADIVPFRTLLPGARHFMMSQNWPTVPASLMRI